MAYLPSSAEGEYKLIPRVIAAGGASPPLQPVQVKINESLAEPAFLTTWRQMRVQNTSNQPVPRAITNSVVFGRGLLCDLCGPTPSRKGRGDGRFSKRPRDPRKMTLFQGFVVTLW